MKDCSPVFRTNHTYSKEFVSTTGLQSQNDSTLTTTAWDISQVKDVLSQRRLSTILLSLGRVDFFFSSGPVGWLSKILWHSLNYHDVSFLTLLS